MTVHKAASGDDGCEEEEEDSAGVRTVNTVTVI